MFNFDLISLVPALGYLGLSVVVFLESGVFFGFFLPGDSVLFSAGLFASHGLFSVFYLIPLLAVAAILGDSFGYWFGAKVGRKICSQKYSFFFKQKHLARVEAYYENFGVRTIIIARFVPVVRTFAPILAGVGHMPYSLFLRYNIIGGVAWSGGVTLLGYFLGAAFPATEHYLLPIVCGIILLSLVPIFIEWYKEKTSE